MGTDKICTELSYPCSYPAECVICLRPNIAKRVQSIAKFQVMIGCCSSSISSQQYTIIGGILNFSACIAVIEPTQLYHTHL